MSGAAVLSLRGVVKDYGKLRALGGVSLDVAAGELVGLLGPNGAGKSTLFQIASGLIAPDGGEVSVFGLDYRRHGAEIRSRLGVVFQSRSLDPDMSVTANLSFHGALFGLTGRELAVRIDEVAELLEIAELIGRPVRTLSGGNQRRVEVARALLNRPDLLLLDEPSSGLDPASRRRLGETMRSVRKSQATAILWATHLVEEIERAERIALIRGGEILHLDTPVALMAQAGVATLTGACIALTGASPDEADQK